MPGILTLLWYAVTYGPQVVRLLIALGPVIDAAKPIVARLMHQGLTETEATTTALSMLAVHRMTAEEERTWFDKATGQIS